VSKEFCVSYNIWSTAYDVCEYDTLTDAIAAAIETNREHSGRSDYSGARVTRPACFDVDDGSGLTIEEREDVEDALYDARRAAEVDRALAVARDRSGQ